jgi:Macrocin-O-methyltransferase (TylF)
VIAPPLDGIGDRGEPAAVATWAERMRFHYGAALDLLTLPLTGFFDEEVGRAHGVGRRQKLAFVYRARRAQRAVPTASTYLEHVAMAASILRVPPSEPGVVIECGCFKGGSTASLSLACRLAGRRLLVFDSFAGLPEPAEGDATHYVPADRTRHGYHQGAFSATLDEVRGNVGRYGALEVCEFRRGFFETTLPGLDERCVFAFADVDLTTSLQTCVEAIWPKLGDGCELWTHEAHHAEIAALFFDDAWWERTLAVSSPGLIGAGSGLRLSTHLPTPIGYTVKNPGAGRRIEQEWGAPA